MCLQRLYLKLNFKVRFLKTLVIFLSIVNAQSLLNDISNLNNNDLDNLRSQLKSNDLIDNEESIDINDMPIIEDSENPNQIDIVEIEAEKIEPKDGNKDFYFGYNYFNSDINFFDNAPMPEDFKLGPGDEIIISLWGETNSREKFLINKDGLIYYKNIGFINLSNKTVNEAESLLVDELSKIHQSLKSASKSTSLMVELGKLKSLNVYFSGEVVKPGLQLIHPFSDIFIALIQAGGINKEGSLRNIELIRNGKVIKKIDFYNFFIEGSKNFSKIKLIDGDTIHVPYVLNRVKVQGEIIKPGYYESIDNDKIRDIINYAAGVTESASSNILLDQIIPLSERLSDDNAVTSKNIKLDNNINLSNGDVITIQRIGEVDNKVTIYGRVKFPGTYAASNSSLFDILDIAGGFNDPTFRKSIDDNIAILRLDENNFYGKEFFVKYEDAKDFLLEINDKIFVYENPNYKNSFSYSISGEVNRPGTYPLKDGLTLSEAIQIAGGITDMGSINSVAVTKTFFGLDLNGNKVEETELVGNIDLNFEITDNNSITILPKTNVVRVSGNVYSPGLVAINNNSMSMYRLIEMAGGYKPYTLKSRSYVIRANGEIEKVNILRGRAKRVFPGDSVFVPTDPNPDEFNITAFIADLSSTLANIAAILLIADNNN